MPFIVVDMAAPINCLEGDVVRMEMVIDYQTLARFLDFGHHLGVLVRDLTLLNPSNYCANDSYKYIPFKYHSENSAVALRFFEAARRQGKVGDACAVLFLKMQKNAFLEALFAGTVVVFADRQSIGFLKALNATNYPSIARGELSLELRYIERQPDFP